VSSLFVEICQFPFYKILGTHLTTSRKRMMRDRISTISQIGISLKLVDELLMSPTFTV
jgi:hypothetical protein